VFIACCHVHLKEENEQNKNKHFDFATQQILTELSDTRHCGPLSDQETQLATAFSISYSYPVVRLTHYFDSPLVQWAQGGFAPDTFKHLTLYTQVRTPIVRK